MAASFACIDTHMKYQNRCSHIDFSSHFDLEKYFFLLLRHTYQGTYFPILFFPHIKFAYRF